MGSPVEKGCWVEEAPQGVIAHAGSSPHLGQVACLGWFGANVGRKGRTSAPAARVGGLWTRHGRRPVQGLLGACREERATVGEGAIIGRTASSAPRGGAEFGGRGLTSHRARSSAPGVSIHPVGWSSPGRRGRAFPEGTSSEWEGGGREAATREDVRGWRASWGTPDARGIRPAGAAALGGRPPPSPRRSS